MKSCWKCDREVPDQSVVCPYCKVSLDEDAIKAMDSIANAAPETVIKAGVVIKDRYEVLELIGKGGMGMVFRARDRMLDQDVALKVIPYELCLDPNTIADLKREIQIAIKLTHENIVRLYTPETWEGRVFMVMEYVGGGTLSHLRAAKGGKLTLEEVLPYLEQVAAAIDYAHNTSPAVIHRDLKPLNILLTESGQVKVADFGLARVLRDSASRVSGHDTSGTLAYMAPEQLRGKGVGRHTDIYALGAIAYELFSGQPPFYTGDLRWQIMHEEVDSIDGVPDHVNKALLRALAKERDHRPDAASGLVALLRQEKPAAVKGGLPSEQEFEVEVEIAPEDRPGDKQAQAEVPVGGKPHKMLAVFLAGCVLVGGYLAYFFSMKDQGRENIPYQELNQAASGPAVGATHTDPTTGMEFVWVEGGCFQMGDTFGDGDDDEQPVHEACLDGLYVGKYEVTQGEYAKIIGTNPSKFNKGDRYPVEKVSWEDAQSFIRKLNSRSGQGYRLPTEAEWEYAARSGGRKEKYAGGNSPDAVAWYTNNSGSTTHPVGMKQANGLGLYDMSGNVWEWCQDWYGKDYYSKSPRSNPSGPSSGSSRVYRGGSWGSSPWGVRAADRYGGGPANRYGNLGFRLVLPVQR